jgi:hypothetical protein
MGVVEGGVFLAMLDPERQVSPSMHKQALSVRLRMMDVKFDQDSILIREGKVPRIAL